MTLPLSLWALKEEIREYAKGYSLDFFEVVYEMVSFEKVNEIAAFGGFPVRYPHWRFGMDYERLSKSHLYGLHKIYEMVINNDPCYAYLVEGSDVIDYKLIMAHVYGHSDFFKNNMWFAHTNRKMMDEMANHATRVRRYIDRFGIERVEKFIDSVLSIDNLVDYHFPENVGRKSAEKPKEEEQETPTADHRFAGVQAPDYLEEFLYPDEYVAKQQKKQKADEEKSKRVPAQPQKDVLYFLAEHAPLEPWERDILSMLREESLYFAPQGQTKIMNEGWAAYWHSKILTEKALQSSEIIDFADQHSKAVAVSGRNINPYKLGLELYRDIEERWNKGRFGKEWEECRDARHRRNWDRGYDLGREKIFEVRKVYNDVSFLDEFLTPEFCIDHKLFTWIFREQYDKYVIDSREFERIKEGLLSQITYFGHPIVQLFDSNFQNRGELLLLHTHEGRDLDMKYASEVLRSITTIWRRPAHIHTVYQREPQLWSHSGTDFSTERYSLPAE